MYYLLKTFVKMFSSNTHLVHWVPHVADPLFCHLLHHTTTNMIHIHIVPIQVQPCWRPTISAHVCMLPQMHPLCTQSSTYFSCIAHHVCWKYHRRSAPQRIPQHDIIAPHSIPKSNSACYNTPQLNTWPVWYLLTIPLALVCMSPLPLSVCRSSRRVRS